MRARARELLEPGSEHEQEQQGLDQRGRHPQAVVAKADQLPPPDDPDGPQLAAQAAHRDVDPDDLGRGRARAHRLPPANACASMRLACWPCFSSASRIVLPVKDMNTSSRVGRATLTDLIGTPAPANARARNRCPE